MRIAVSELCSLVSRRSRGDRHAAVPGPATGRSTVDGRVAHRARRDHRRTSCREAIVAAVIDEHSLVTDDGVTRFRVSSASTPRRLLTLTELVRTRRRRLSGDWSLRRPGREGPARSTCPRPLGPLNPSSGRNFSGHHYSRSMLLRRRLLLLFVAIVAGVVVLGAAAMVVTLRRAGRRRNSGSGGSRSSLERVAQLVDRLRRPGDRRTRLRRSAARRRSWSRTTNGRAAARRLVRAAPGCTSTPPALAGAAPAGRPRPMARGAARRPSPRSRSRRAGDRRRRPPTRSPTGSGKALFDRCAPARRARHQRRRREDEPRAQHLDDVRARAHRALRRDHRRRGRRRDRRRVGSSGAG